MPAVRKLISYTDLDGNPQEAEYWFQLGRTDAIELDFVHREDPQAYLQSIADNKESRSMMEVWKDMLFRSVAKRVDNHLVRNQQILDEFVGSGAYESFFNEIAVSGDGGSKFFMSIMPEDVQAKGAEETDRANRDYTDEELLAMSDDAFRHVAGKNERDWSKRHLLIGMQRRNAS